MLTPETLLQLQKYNFDLLARQEPSGLRRLRYIALAHIKDGKTPTETTLALRVTRRVVTRWLKWFIDEGLDRVTGVPHYWSTQRLPLSQGEAFRQAVEQLQHRRGGGRVRGEEVRQLLAQQFSVDYTFNGVYELFKRLDMAWISARSVSLNANPARQAKFKKNCPKRHRPVNLQSEGGEQFLQTAFTQQVETPQDVEAIKTHLPLVRSRILLLLLSKRSSEISTVEGKK